MSSNWLKLVAVLFLCAATVHSLEMAEDGENATNPRSTPVTTPETPTAPTSPSPEEEAPLEARLLEAWRVPLSASLVSPLLTISDQVVVSLETGEIRALAGEDGSSRWQVQLEDELIAGPVLFGGEIIQSSTGGRVVALDPSNGEILWRKELGHGIEVPITPAGGQLLVPLSSGELVSLDEKGQERWRARLKGQPTGPVGICRGLAVVGIDAGAIVAFDGESGLPRWELKLAANVASPFLCHKKLIYFGTDDYRFHAIKTKGKRKWNYKVGGNITTTPIFVDDRVYFLSFDNFLYALKARAGHLLLKVKLSHRLSSDLLRTEDRIYLSPYTSARLISLRLPELQLLSEYDLGLEGEWFTTPPVRIGDYLFIGYGRTQGRVLALKEQETSPEPSTP